MKCLRKTGPSFTPEDQSIRWSLGKRIHNAISPTVDTQTVTDTLSRYILDDKLENLQSLAVFSSLPLAKVDVFCAPCTCAVRTALAICQSQSNELIQYLVKVDDRLPSDCCPESTKSSSFESLLHVIQCYEVGLLGGRDVNLGWAEYLDRVWIEQRLYEMQSSSSAFTSSQETNRYRITRLLSEVPSTYSVFLAECSNLSWMLQLPPFPTSSRLPRENEIYELFKGGHKSPWSLKFLGSFTPRDYGTKLSSDVTVAKEIVTMEDETRSDISEQDQGGRIVLADEKIPQ